MAGGFDIIPQELSESSLNEIPPPPPVPGSFYRNHVQSTLGKRRSTHM